MNYILRLTVLFIAISSISCKTAEELTRVYYLTAPVTDADGNLYQTTGIGSQVWMAENLKTTKYNDSTQIISSEEQDWGSIATGVGSYTYLNRYKQYSNSTYGYGALYNWFAVDTEKLCPLGWHIPNESEWNELIIYVGSNTYLLKDKRFYHWRESVTKNNSSGFPTLSGGLTEASGVSEFKEQFGFWWSSKSSSKNGAIGFQIEDSSNQVSTFDLNKKAELPIRCLKDY